MPFLQSFGQGVDQMCKLSRVEYPEYMTPSKFWQYWGHEWGQFLIHHGTYRKVSAGKESFYYFV
jgi:hypothetical protein